MKERFIMENRKSIILPLSNEGGGLISFFKAVFIVFTTSEENWIVGQNVC